MATTLSRVTASPDPEEEELDLELSSLRAKICKVRSRKRILTSSLLTTDPVQKLLRNPAQVPTSLNNIAAISPLVHAAGAHTSSNHHRIAFSATAFPFKDPSPTATVTNLLGLRLDVCTRNGRFTKPYYVLLRQEPSHTAAGSAKVLKVHRHTVPSFISIPRLERVYLPRAHTSHKNDDREGSAEDEAEAADPAKPWKKSSRAVLEQDVRGFVRELRRELVAWHMRTDAIDFLREKLGLVGEDGEPQPFDVSPDRDTGIVSLAAAALEARYVRLEWADGRVGRFKLSNAGIVERAVVIGDEGRDKKTEDAMTGGGGRVETVLDRLKVDVSSKSP
ncbi:Centromere protein Cenp-O [Penicillium bovifimosum]|uniref:Centromere protein Cenp-O n=1 Tax=Penicillium bovifimosum TaxID=126998 RepID=A0A9W9KWX9_9EURO|nr:Centromere protein Cenp-O [Penicillium bovifimosum]KAJ5124150.1 Centromere protein Cenp-O [Penicillium bovifimosum]